MRRTRERARGRERECPSLPPRPHACAAPPSRPRCAAQRTRDEQAALGVEVEQGLHGGGMGGVGVQAGRSGRWVGGRVGGRAGGCCGRPASPPPHTQTHGRAAGQGRAPTCQRWLFQFLIMWASSRMRYFHFLRLNMRASCECACGGGGRADELVHTCLRGRGRQPATLPSTRQASHPPTPHPTCSTSVYEVMQTWKELGLDQPWRLAARSFTPP